MGTSGGEGGDAVVKGGGRAAGGEGGGAVVEGDVEFHSSPDLSKCCLRSSFMR